jgi:hypothetical protein
MIYHKSFERLAQLMNNSKMSGFKWGDNYIEIPIEFTLDQPFTFDTDTIQVNGHNIADVYDNLPSILGLNTDDPVLAFNALVGRIQDRFERLAQLKDDSKMGEAIAHD